MSDPRAEFELRFKAACAEYRTQLRKLANELRNDSQLSATLPWADFGGDVQAQRTLNYRTEGVFINAFEDPGLHST